MALPTCRRQSPALTRWLAILAAVLYVTLSPVTSFRTKPWRIEKVTYTKVKATNWAQSCIESQTYPCKLPSGTFPWGHTDYDKFINEDVYSLQDVPNGDQLRELVKIFKKVKLSCIIGHCMGLGHRVLLTRTIPGVLYPFPPAGSPVEDPVMKVWMSSFSGVEVKVFEPRAISRKLRRGLLYFHGGGWAVGSADAMSAVTYELAKLADMVVVSVNYRLAPEHVFPTQINDCVKATKYFMRYARRFGVDCNRIIVAGDSAGATLAAAVALQLRDTYRRGPKLKMQVLLYPALQTIDFNTPSYQKNVCDPALDQAYMLSFWLWYAFGTNGTSDFNLRDFSRNYHTTASAKAKYGRYVDWRLLPPKSYTPQQKYRANRYRCGSSRIWARVERVFTNPYFAPLMTSTTKGLPRAYIMAMEHDILRDENIIYARRLQAGRVKVKLAICKGTHGLFNNMAMAYTQRELGRVAKYIVDYV